MRGRVVGLERTINGTGVKVDSGVKVGIEITVGVDTNTGIAAAVCVKAALAVWAMRRLIELGSSVGAGVIAAGAHDRINTSLSDQSSNFLPGMVMKPLENRTGITTNSYSQMISCGCAVFYVNSQ